jgi:hypothetical protein
LLFVDGFAESPAGLSDHLKTGRRYDVLLYSFTANKSNHPACADHEPQRLFGPGSRFNRSKT